MEQQRMLVKKLAKVMQEVKYIQKKGLNNFHNYKYATESDVAEKVREVLAEQNVIMIPNMTSHSIREHITAKGNREYIATVNMEFKFIDGETGEEITFNIVGEGQDSGDKATYKAITGAQKYALMKTFMIPTGDDPEADESVDERNAQEQSKPPKQPPQSSKLITDAQLKALNASISELKKYGPTEEQIRAELAKVEKIGLFTSLKDLPIGSASLAIEKVKEWTLARKKAKEAEVTQ